MTVISSNGTGGGNWNLTTTWAGGVLPDNNLDDVIVVNGDTVALTSGDQCKSFRVDIGGIYDGQGYPLQINGEADGTGGTSNGYAIDIDGELHTDNDSDFDVRTQASTYIDLTPTNAGKVRNLIINDSLCTAILASNTEIAGNITITAGTLDTSSSNNRALTVTGYTTINGGSAGNEVAQLNLNGSTAILGSGITSAAGVSVQNGGGFYADADSTVTMGSLDANYDGNNEVRLLGTNVIDSYSDTNRILKLTLGVIDTTGTNITITTATTGKTISCFDTQFGNLTLTPASSTTYNMVSSGIDIGGDLTINANATLDTTASNYPLTVTGDVSVTGTLTGNASAISMGSLTIASAGTYSATSGTTTITDENGGYAINLDGTYIHNKGLLKSTYNGSTNMDLSPSSGNVYDFEYAGGSIAYYYDADGTPEILNNVKLSNNSTLSPGFGDDNIIIHGLTTVDSGSTWTATTGNVTHHGLLTNAGTYATGSGTNNFNGGVRNLGTFTSDDTLTIGGTGGIIEGDLDDADIDINLDAVLDFDGVNDYVTVADHATLDIATAITVSAWIKKSGTVAGYDMIVNKWASSLGYQFGLWVNKIYIQGDGVLTAASGNLTWEDDVWYHVAGTIDEGDASASKVYVNGVDVTATTATASLTANSEALDIGADGGGSALASTIADVRVYDVALSQANIQVLASKINGDSSLGAGAGDLQGWWKLDEGTGTSATDSSANSNTGTLTNGPAWAFDAFSVNVQDNTTTTDGTFDVSQGKLEGLGLSSANFDGSDDYIAIGNYETTMRGSHTWSLWFKATDGRTGTGQMLIGTTDASANEALLMNIGSSNGSLSFGYIVGNDSKDTVVTPVLIDGQNPWHLYTVAVTVIDTNSFRYNMFLDGVQIGDETHTGVNLADLDLSTNIDIGAWNFGGFTRLLDYTGLIRDVRLYDYALLDEQMASLYSNTLPQTPLHHWMLDEGTGTTATDSGTSTSDGTYTGATHNNGTLGLDSTLTIEANGTLSAPRGNLDFAGNFDINCTNVDPTSAGNQFIHNNGKFRFVAANGADFTPNNATFFNIDLVTSTGHDLDLRENITIIGTLDLTGLTDYFVVDAANAAGNITMTMGDDDNQATIESNTADTFRFNPHSSNEILITGGSSLKPCLVTGQDWKWDNGAAGAAGIKLANMNFDPDIVTDTGTGNAVKIILTGDCEFDAVTVSAGDTLDLNGQRAVFSGNLSNQSSSPNGIDYDGMIYFTGSGRMDSDGYSTNLDKLTLVQQGTATSDGDLASDGTIKTFLYNQPSVTQKNHRGAIQTIVGAGTWTCGTGESPDFTDLTVATGGTLDGSSSTLTVAGDFTTNGGLIGKSAYSSDGAAANYGTGAGADLSSTSGPFTIEQWVKRADYSTVEKQLCQMDDLQIYFTSDGTLRVKCGDNSIAKNPDGSNVAFSTLGDNKWYHIAVVYDGSASTKRRVFIDGKEYTLSDSDSDITLGNVDNYYIGRYHGDTNYNLDGQIGYLRIWDEARTVTEIRANMFKRAPTDASTKCKINLVFDEGTGVDVENIGTELAAGDGTLNVGGTTLWAGAGTLTWDETDGNPSAGTLNMTGAGTTPTLTCKSATKFFNVTVGSSGEVTLAGHPYIYGLLTVDSNGITDGAGSEIIGIAGTTTPVVHASKDFSDISQIHYQTGGGAITITPTTYAICRLTNSTPATLVGAFVGTTLQVDSGCSLTAQNTTIQTRGFNINGANAGIDVTNTDVTLTDASPYGFTGANSTTTFTAGPTTNFVGHASKSKFVSESNFEIVGNTTNLDVTNQELVVAGSVTNCTTSDGGSILQWHHSQDYNQRLDTDTADDRDLKLGGPALDNANHLNT